MFTTTIPHWIYVQSPEMLIALGAASALLFVSVAFILVEAFRSGPVYDQVAAGHADASRSMPLAARMKALPCIECPHLRASRQQPVPGDRFSCFVPEDCQ